MKEAVTIKCDVSEKGLGATQLQKGQAFAPRTFSQVEQHYAQIEKECPAIVFACSKFIQYITIREVTVESDHKLLQPVFERSLVAASCRLQKICYNFKGTTLRYSIYQIPMLCGRLPVKSLPRSKRRTTS